MPAARRDLQALLLIPLLAGLGAVAIGLINPVFPVDDAYITLHNARSLIGGGADPVYGGNATVGATSLVHLALLAALGTVLPLEAASHVLTVAAVVLYALGLVRLAQAHAADPWLVAGLGLLPAQIPFALTNGMETGLAMAAIVWLLVLMDRPSLGWVAGLAAFVRPTVAVLAAILGLRRLWQLRGSWRSLALFVGSGLIAALPFLLWSWETTGSILPSTGAAKVAFFADVSHSLKWRIGVGFNALYLSMMLPLAIGALGLFRITGGAALMLWVVIWSGLSVWNFPSGLRHNEYRYLTELVPVLVLGWIGLAAWVSAPALRLTLKLLGGAFLLSGISGLETRLDAPLRTARFETLRRDAGQHIPAGSRVLIHDAGYLAWARPDLRLVDIVGLKTPRNIPVHQRLTISGRADDRNEALVAITADSGADYLVELSGDPFWRQTSVALRGAGWQLDQLGTAPAPTTVVPGRYYHIYRLRRPAGQPAAR